MSEDCKGFHCHEAQERDFYIRSRKAGSAVEVGQVHRLAAVPGIEQQSISFAVIIAAVA